MKWFRAKRLEVVVKYVNLSTLSHNGKYKTYQFSSDCTATKLVHCQRWTQWNETNSEGVLTFYCNCIITKFYSWNFSCWLLYHKNWKQICCKNACFFRKDFNPLRVQCSVMIVLELELFSKLDYSADEGESTLDKQWKKSAFSPVIVFLLYLFF